MTTFEEADTACLKLRQRVTVLRDPELNTFLSNPSSGQISMVASIDEPKMVQQVILKKNLNSPRYINEKGRPSVMTLKDESLRNSINREGSKAMTPQKSTLFATDEHVNADIKNILRSKN